MRFFRSAALLLAATVIASSPAFAADAEEGDGAWEFDVAFGVAVTSRYVSRGADQSRGPVVQAYIEPTYGIFYAGVWGSGVNFGGGDPDRVEYNLYAGIRPEFGNFSFDLGYAHYLYNRSGECCGEFYGKVTYTFNDYLAVGGEIYVDPRFSTSYGVANAEISLPHDFTFSAAVGTWFDRPSSGNVDWNAGISYTFADTVTIDARYHDSNFQPARFVVSLSVDTTLKTLLGN